VVLSGGGISDGELDDLDDLLDELVLAVADHGRKRLLVPGVDDPASLSSLAAQCLAVARPRSASRGVISFGPVISLQYRPSS